MGMRFSQFLNKDKKSFFHSSGLTDSNKRQIGGGAPVLGRTLQPKNRQVIGSYTDANVVSSYRQIAAANEQKSAPVVDHLNTSSPADDRQKMRVERSISQSAAPSTPTSSPSAPAGRTGFVEPQSRSHDPYSR